MVRSNAIILGGGLIGSVQALALAAHGLSCHIVERADPQALTAAGFDGRTSALSSSSMAMLDAIGLGSQLAGKGCPIHRIEVMDGLGPRPLEFAPRPDEPPLGHMFENRLLRRTLLDAIRTSEHIQLHAPAEPRAIERDQAGVRVTLTTGETLAAPLLIVAEGRNSPTREAAGIRVARWSYDHVALVGAIRHEQPHRNIAWEIFFPTGPFAILPMLDDEAGRHRSAIVWSRPRSERAGWLKLSDRAVAAELQQAMGALLGAVELAAPLSAYPLGFHHAASVTAERLALIGDAAHGIHPIAGQGLNLGLRDVASLTEVLVEGARLGLDAGDHELLARYQRWRGLDALSVAFATDSLTRLFGLPGRPARAVRRLGLRLVAALPPAKRFFVENARGSAGTLPRLLEGVPV